MIVLDVLVIGSWLVLGTHLFDALGVPRWLQYALVFLGVVAYTQVTPQWEAVGD